MGASDAKIDVVRARCRRGAAEAPKNLITGGLGLRLTGSQRVGGEASFLEILGITCRSVNRPNCAVS